MEFEELTPNAMREAVERAIEAADRRVAAAVAAPQPTYAAVVGQLGNAVLETWDAFGRTAAFATIHPDDAIRAAAREADEALNKWRAGLFERDDVGAAVRRVAAAAELGELVLDDDERPALDRWLAETALAGYALGTGERREVAAGRARLVELGVRFAENIEGDRRTVELAADELDGLPPALIERLPAGSARGSRLVAMDASERIPVLERATNRAARERIVRTWFDQAVETNEPVLAETIRLRRRLAGLLGHDSWMDLQTSGAMAGDRATVLDFMDHLSRGLNLAVADGIARMTDHVRRDEGDPAAVAEEWDWRFYDAAERDAVGVEAQTIAEYLPADAALAGLFELTADVFGIRVIEEPDVRGWHPDVRRFRFEDVAAGAVLGHALFDLLPRPGKLPGAWAYPIHAGHHDPDGQPRLPFMGLVASLTPPGPSTPSLLTPQDLETLFHEFGHVLEGILESSGQVAAEGRWLGWDWIESASQIMEHWTSRPEIVGRFARHYRTGEPMPPELLEALPATRRIGLETTTLRLTYMTMVDVWLHGPEASTDLEDANRRAWSILPFPFVEGGFYPAQVSHLLGGYDGLLYGYLWAQVYGDDMFSRFETEGTRSAQVGADYRREILAAPWTRPQVDRLRRFLGREPSNEAFLARLGLSGSATAA
ncbi:MAG TPA: M3 family metallopeptidase [Candidatus Limnocylindrales bacterium]|nr:M3 family metallopeptidase [Candidatus Limnocylindrales bacterium]